MIVDQMGALLQELSTILKTPLRPDERNGCLLKYRRGIEVHLELERDENFLLLLTHLPLPPQGPYQERILRVALVENYSSDIGVFSISTKERQLVFFRRINMEDLRGAILAEQLESLVERALLWKDALDHGDAPLLIQNSSSKSALTRGKGLFGL